MFVTRDYAGYNRHGEQSAAGLFLILFSPPGDFSPSRPGGLEIRGVVRHVRMRQCGHWMMGSARIGPVRVTLSGDYGADGLTNDCPANLWPRLHPLPQELADQKWGDNTGWNSAGESGHPIRAWARKNLNTLRVLLPDPSPPPRGPRVRNFRVVCAGPGYGRWPEPYDPARPDFLRHVVRAANRPEARCMVLGQDPDARILWTEEGRR